MASQIPYCGICRQARDAEIEMAKGMKEARRKEKGKGKAKDWGGSESDEEVDEWGGGLPGIMKVSFQQLSAYKAHVKPDITFFGQALESEFDECLFQDREKVDLLVIIGTSLKVAPVSEVLSEYIASLKHARPDNQRIYLTRFLKYSSTLRRSTMSDRMQVCLTSPEAS